jgi:peptidoglycan/xylan/chitin deacetylase (PgdA/CDA1 family)
MISVVRDARGLWEGVFGGRYPDYLRGQDVEGHTPAFIYHEIRKEDFRRHLVFLKENGYQTLSADEFLQYTVRPGHSYSGRSVLLTFDDGLESLNNIVYPLLKEFNATAVAFILPGWVGYPGITTWAEIQAMHESGHVDFQSHSYFHSAIPVSSQRVSVRASSLMPWDFPVSSEWDGKSRPAFAREVSSVYKHRSRMSDVRRFYSNGKTESAREQSEGIESELVRSKEAIEANLQGKTVRHFAYPWSDDGNIARALLPRCGYAAGYVGLYGQDPSPANSFDPYRLKRLSAEFLECLPGKGRKPLKRVLCEKASRRWLR